MNTIYKENHVYIGRKNKSPKTELNRKKVNQFGSYLETQYS